MAVGPAPPDLDAIEGRWWDTLGAQVDLVGIYTEVVARGLCGAHYQQAKAGKPLKPAWERIERSVKLGSIRLPEDTARRLRAVAKSHS